MMYYKKTTYKHRGRQKVTNVSIRRGEGSGILRVVVLGGLEEVGRNMTFLEYGDDIIIIDMGLQFPEEDMPGIDYIIPNISYFQGKEKNIKGVIITHAHYDHIGGIPHLIPKLGNPTIYTGQLSSGIIAKRQEEYRDAPKLNIQVIDSHTKIRLGNSFNVEFFRVNHNIPDSFGVAVQTPLGTVVHTGDFKIDHSPVNDQPADLNRIAQIGGRGVLLLMSDSTNAEEAGYQISESQVMEEMERIFEQATGRLIIGTFASLLSRVQQIITLAEKFDRRVYTEGRSMTSNIEIAHKMGYLKVKPGTIIEKEEVNKLPDNKLVLLGSGAQGERNAFLVRLANDEHPFLNIKDGDTVIFSSSVIPGNERTIQNLKDTLARKGAKIIHYKLMDVHAGGHSKQEDLKLMIRLIRPHYFIPIHANHYMLKTHAELAHSVGLSWENIFVPDNGQVVEFHRDPKDPLGVKGTLTEKRVPADYVMVDGLGVGDVSNIVLRDRRLMSADGMIVIIATINTKTGRLIGNPDIISRGFVYMKEQKELIEKTRHKVKKICEDHDKKSPAFEDHLKNKIRNNVGEFLYKQTKRRPMVLPVIIKV